MSETAYPLSWPAGWKRTPGADRKRARFSSKGSSRMAQSLTVAQALRRLQDALGHMGVRDWETIISTNVQLRRDGLPYSGQKEPADPGAAVYWRDKLKAEIIRSRRIGSITKAKAREMFDEADDMLTPGPGEAPDLELQRLIESVFDYCWWDHIPQEVKPSYRYLRRIVQAIRAALGQAQQVAA